MTRAVIYARYSSNNQTEQSIEGQIRVCTEYAKVKGLTVVDEYVDRAISGRTDNRPDFQRLMQDCSKGIFDAVIVYRTDRFARNKYDSAIYKRQLRKNGIELHYAAECIPDGPEGIILESLMEGLAEYYSAELSQKIRRGIHESALKCKATGGNLALGYKIAADKSFVINEKEAFAVKTVFDMYIKQETNSAICKYLNDLGMKTSRGNAFNKDSIPRIITNEKYMGVYKCGNVRIENGVPAIVSKEVFELAQQENDRRKVSKQAALPRAKYLLAGKLFCGHCKKKMVGVSGTSKTGLKHYYYYCPSARKKQNCDKKQVTKNWIEELVVKETLAHVLTPEAISYISKACYEIQLKDPTKNEEIEFYKRRIAENKKALNNMIKAIESGVITESLPKRIKELETIGTQLETKLKKAEANNIIITAEHIEFMLQQFANKKDSESEESFRKKIIDCFVSEVYLYDDKLLIYFNIDDSHTDLSEKEISFVESTKNSALAGPAKNDAPMRLDGFDQRALSSTIVSISRTPGEKIYIFSHGFVLVTQL